MYKVLLVEDEPMMCKGLQVIVEKSDLPIGQVSVAYNGEEALSMIKEDIPDIVITDIRMPKVDGLQLCKELYKNYRHVNIVIVSGYGDFSYAQEAIKYQVKDYILKPYSKVDIIDTLNKIIRTIEKSNSAYKISYKELENLIALLDQGIWNNESDKITRCFEEIFKYFSTMPLNISLKIMEEIMQNLLISLSNKIGHKIGEERAAFNGSNLNDLKAYFKATIDSIEKELKNDNISWYNLCTV